MIPFLENVTRGRGIPRERLKSVAEHYYRFDGVSPINGHNRALVTALSERLDIPVYWGNRNWHPLLTEEVGRMKDDGVKRTLAFVTSAYGGYSSCRQYLDDIAAARETAGAGAPEIDKLRLFYNHPEFVAFWVASLQQALTEVGRRESGPAGATAEGRHAGGTTGAGGSTTTGAGTEVPVLFSAHSIPTSMANTSPYRQQVSETARLVAAGAGVPDEQWQLVWQSRSGPPTQPWLEPSLEHAIQALPAGTHTTVVVPIGFVSDHMEVAFDIDIAAKELAASRGIDLVRAATPGSDPRFVDMICSLVEERQDPHKPRPALGETGPWPDVCPEGHCPRPQRPGAGADGSHQRDRPKP